MHPTWSAPCTLSAKARKGSAAKCSSPNPTQPNPTQPNPTQPNPTPPHLLVAGGDHTVGSQVQGQTRRIKRILHQPHDLCAESKRWEGEGKPHQALLQHTSGWMPSKRSDSCRSAVHAVSTLLYGHPRHIPA